MNMPFSGSYAPDDVSFLLKKLTIDPVNDLDLKERLIQSGKKHYSEMISKESLPSAEYFSLYEQAVEDNKLRIARDCLSIADHLVAEKGRDITLVSLARAGTPFGVLLRRMLKERFFIDSPHYSISIIRDRGIDANALDYIRKSHSDSSIAFIDGWSGKGAICRELKSTISAYNNSRGASVNDALYVAVDLAGVAAAAGSGDDYLIPSAILNAPVSGLISRTILNEMIVDDDWHGCLFYGDWLGIDRSAAYIETIMQASRTIKSGLDCLGNTKRKQINADMVAFVHSVMSERGITNDNLVKPGIGEATRAVLRRAPKEVLVRDLSDPDIQPLRSLCDARGVMLTSYPYMPVRATAIIRSLGDV